MTNGTSGDERHRKVRAGLAFSCEGSSDALWAITRFQIRKRFTASELFSGFLAPDKLQDTTAIQRRRFVAAPGRAGKAYWLVERHPKIIAAPILLKNRGIKIRPPGYT